MKIKRVIDIDGILNVSKEHDELSITEYRENDGFIVESEHDLLELLDSYDGKRVKVNIEVEYEEMD